MSEGLEYSTDTMHFIHLISKPKLVTFRRRSSACDALFHLLGIRLEGVHASNRIFLSGLQAGGVTSHLYIFFCTPLSPPVTHRRLPRPWVEVTQEWGGGLFFFIFARLATTTTPRFFEGLNFPSTGLGPLFSSCLNSSIPLDLKKNPLKLKSTPQRSKFSSQQGEKCLPVPRWKSTPEGPTKWSRGDLFLGGGYEWRQPEIQGFFPF